MIRDLSLTLQALLEDPDLALAYPELAAAQVSFERPDSSFTPSSPTIDLFLYEIRENVELRNNEPTLERLGGRANLRKPPRHISCSYLVTAWPVDGADLALQEHRLLSQALRVLSGYPTIPDTFLQGLLVGQEPPPPTIVPQIDGLTSPAEFWSAMGNEVRAAYTITATIRMPVFPDVDGPLVTTLAEGFGLGAAGAIDERIVQIGGRVLDAAGNGIGAATVDLLRAGRARLRARSGADGRYRMPHVPEGANTIRVVAVGFQPLTATVDVPGRTEDYEFTLAPL